MRALVTGTCGFAGKYLARHLVECGDEVLGTVYADQDFSEAFSTRVLDVSNASATADLISEYRPEVIYHLAAISFVPEAEDNFGRTMVINVAGVNNVIRPCHLLELGTKIVIVSSAEVYGKISQDDLPLTEATAVKPANNYSLSKLMAEMIGPRYERGGTVKTVTIRPFNHIGPGQNNRFVASSFAHQLAQIAKGKMSPVLKVGNLDAKRDFSDVRDIVRGYRLAAEKGSGVYNLCSGEARPISWILNTLIEVSGLEVEIQQDPGRMRPAEVPEIRGSYARAEAELGWKPERDLKESLREIYQYWLAHS